MPQAQFETDDATLATLIDELRVIAHAARRRLPVGETLATTALVNEAFLKLSRPNSANAVDQRHFFALAARAMREILIDEARRRALSQAQRHMRRTKRAAPENADRHDTGKNSDASSCAQDDHESVDCSPRTRDSSTAWLHISGQNQCGLGFVQNECFPLAKGDPRRARS
jgi:hypothetical protein